MLGFHPVSGRSVSDVPFRFVHPLTSSDMAIQRHAVPLSSISYVVPVALAVRPRWLPQQILPVTTLSHATVVFETKLIKQTAEQVLGRSTIIMHGRLVGGYQHWMNAAGPGRRVIQFAERRRLIVTDDRQDFRAMSDEGGTNV